MTRRKSNIVFLKIIDKNQMFDAVTVERPDGVSFNVYRGSKGFAQLNSVRVNRWVRWSVNQQKVLFIYPEGKKPNLIKVGNSYVEVKK